MVAINGDCEIGCKEEFRACREDDDLFANSHQPRNGKNLPSKQVFANKLASSMLTNECGSLLVTKAIVWRILMQQPLLLQSVTFSNQSPTSKGTRIFASSFFCNWRLPTSLKRCDVIMIQTDVVNQIECVTLKA